MSSQYRGVIPAASPEAVESILEAIDFIEKGDREVAGRAIEGSYRATVGLLGTAPRSDPVWDRMGFDFVHYAMWAIKLDLVDLVTNSGFRAQIKDCRKSPPIAEASPELTVRFELLFERSRRNPPQALGRSRFQGIVGNLRRPRG